MVARGKAKQPIRQEEFFELATSLVPRSVLAQMQNKELLGIWRHSDDKHRGELVFCVNDIFYRAETPLLDWDIVDYSIVLFKKSGIMTTPSSYRIFGAGEERNENFLQILKWTDFIESVFPLYSFIVTGNNQITLRDSCHKIHSKKQTEVLILDEHEGVMAKGFSYQASDSGGIVNLDRSKIDFASKKDFDKSFTSKSVTDESTRFSDMSFNGVGYCIWHGDDDRLSSIAERLGKTPFEIAEFKKSSRFTNVGPEAFILAKSIFKMLPEPKGDNGSMILFSQIVRDYPEANEEFVQSTLERHDFLFTMRGKFYGLRTIVADTLSCMSGDNAQEEVKRRAKEEAERRVKEEAERRAKAVERKAMDDNLKAEKVAVIALWEALKKAGWQYPLRDIVRLHTSVKTGALTILAGASGVGKSSLFKHYARFMTGCENEGELWKRMNVVSTWMEPSDLLGWKSPLANNAKGSDDFQRAPGGLFDFLNGLQTEDKKGKLSLLCFEEMNLAQAELYFSDFLQAISDPFEERKISNPNGGDFKIPHLRIVGTCNIDHTTKPFTERFLDRCNYIDLSSPDTGKSIEEFFSTKLPDERPTLPQPSNVLYSRKEISDDAIKQVSAVMQESNWKELITVFSKLQIFPSDRVRNAMLEYILARPALKDTGGISSNPGEYYIEPQENIKLGLDEAFVQRILPKLLLRGEWDKDDRFTKRIGKLSDLCEANGLDLPLSKAFINNHLTNGSKG